MSSLPRHPDVIRAGILVAVTLVIAALFTGMIANHAHSDGTGAFPLTSYTVSAVRITT